MTNDYGRFVWYDLMSPDTEASKTFYTRVLGLGHARRSWCYYVRVNDVRETIDKVQQNKGQVINGPMEVPGGDWIAQCRDTSGGMFAVHQIARR
jgi:predicted enzyme related to lactoylglutathione lyase